MIKANELRIGNILYSNLTNTFFVCDSEDIYNLSMDYNFENAKPIVLTEEWLVRFGFKFKKCGACGQDEWAGLDIWSIPCLDTGHFITIRGSSINSFILYPYTTYIQYVHQLQNLYFALTGEELH